MRGAQGGGWLRRDVERGVQVFAQLFLPVGNGLRVEVVHGGNGAFAHRAEALQFAVKVVAVGAVVRVAFVAEGEQVVAGVGERGAGFFQAAAEADGVVRRVAVAGGAGDEDEGFAGKGFHRVARVPGVKALCAGVEAVREVVGQRFCLAALAGVEQEQGAVVARGARAALPEIVEPVEGLRGDEGVGKGGVHGLVWFGLAEVVWVKW